MDIDEILERAEQVEEKDAGESEHELLGVFKASSYVYFSLFYLFARIAKQPKSALQASWHNFFNLFFIAYVCKISSSANFSVHSGC